MRRFNNGTNRYYIYVWLGRGIHAPILYTVTSTNSITLLRKYMDVHGHDITIYYYI